MVASITSTQKRQEALRTVRVPWYWSFRFLIQQCTNNVNHFIIYLTAMHRATTLYRCNDMCYLTHRVLFLRLNSLHTLVAVTPPSHSLPSNSHPPATTSALQPYRGVSESSSHVERVSVQGGAGSETRSPRWSPTTPHIWLDLDMRVHKGIETHVYG